MFTEHEVHQILKASGQLMLTLKDQHGVQLKDAIQIHGRGMVDQTSGGATGKNKRETHRHPITLT